jgi:hypothetical protein
MKYFFVKLGPPRPDFAQSMTDEERAVMGGHQAYWRSLLAKGWVAAYGPVADPAGSYGAGFWMLPEDQDPGDLAGQDPAILSGRGFRYEIQPMLALVTPDG